MAEIKFHVKMVNELIEMQALICEREGMVAENAHRQHAGYSPAYCEYSFLILAEKMRALKDKVGLPNSNQQPQAVWPSEENNAVVAAKLPEEPATSAC
jgi:hypothetical protein